MSERKVYASQAGDPDQDAARLRHERLLAVIREQAAAAGGALSFDTFMELALYAPGLGYYVAGLPKLGPAGDFVTAPEISPAFGRCVAAQCAEAFAVLGGGELLEFGAGSGVLAADILAELARRDALPERYLILEPSPDLQARQRELLRARQPEFQQRVHWLAALPSDFQGVVIANEVLDAMPVHRFCIGEDAEVREVLVAPTADGVGLHEVLGEPRSPGLCDAVRALQEQDLVLDAGYRSELNLRLPAWMRALSGALARALVLIIDYGYPRAEYYHWQRREGTLIGHYRHQTQGNLFERLGQQDISAHVDFSAVAQSATAAGLSLAGYTTQAQFLIGCGLDAVMTTLLEEASDPHRQMRLSAGARQLIMPAAMGERFQVMALARDLDHAWRGFSARDLRDRLC